MIQIEALRTWIVSICTTVFFITAVEMILPDNTLKKYSKFVLGLILMTVIINPLVRFLNEGSDVTTFIGSSTLSIEEKYQEENPGLREKSIEDTLSVFKINLEKTCEKKLKDKFSKGKFKVEAQISYNKESQEYIVENINVGITNGTVDKIQKIEIRTNSSLKNDSEDDSKYGMEVKDYLSSVVELPQEKIRVYKLAKR